MTYIWLVAITLTVNLEYYLKEKEKLSMFLKEKLLQEKAEV